MRIGLLPTEKGGSYRFTILLIAIIGLLISSLPVVIVILMSFSLGETPSFPPEEFSLHWYKVTLDLFTGEDLSSSQPIGQAFFNSLLIGGIVMLISIAVSIPLAYSLVRGNKKFREGMELLFTLPLLFPVVILGIAFLLVAEGIGIEMGVWRLVIPHVTLVMPFVMRNCISAMSGISRETEEAAVSLGASPIRVALDIIIPLMKPGILAGLIFAFIISFNEFTVTFFMYTIDLSTLPIWMYSRTVSSLHPSALTVSVFIIIIDLILITIIDKIVTKHGNLF